MNSYAKSLVVVLCMVLLIACRNQKTNDDQIETIQRDFLTPPNAVKPRVWWHWMNGNISEEGIQKDLQWMYNSGIGGFQNFDASLNTPQVVGERMVYMTPKWKDAFRFTAKLADSLKLEMAIAGSPGWSETGGPWVTPEDGMKKLVWTETLIKGGGGKVSVRIPQSDGTTGPFQNIPKQPDFGASPMQTKSPELYNDVAIIAYKLPATEIPLNELNPKITSSGGKFSLSQLTDGDVAKTSLLPSDIKNGFAWIQFDLNGPTTVKALTIVGGGDKGQFGLFGELADTRALESSEDGRSFKQVCFIPASNVLQQTISFPPVTARYFRVTFKNPPAQPNFGALFGANASSAPPAGTEIAELVLHTGSRINWAEEKAAFAPAMNLADKETPSSDDPILPNDVIDLTTQLNSDGTLNWTPPNGTWNVLRFGYSLIGKTNHPASPEATGLEVDKINPEAIRRYFTTYLDQYKEASGGLMGDKGGLQFMVTDSWEAGAQNWTQNIFEEFQKRRGYDLHAWMPVLTGKVVNNSEASEQFLFDFRNTLSEMVAEYHYDGLTKILDTYGMKRYSESHEDGRAMIADGMDVKRTAAIPMSAMWTPNPFINQFDLTKYEADIRESASVAHIYGQNIVAAESLTALGVPASAWSYSPENLKPTADLELASGLNRFVIHTSVHQPVDDKIPGLGLGPFGQWFTRHETWANNASAWTDYLSRSSYLLQQGRFVADVLVYYGEDNNITSLYRKNLPDIPEGYAYDFINPHALTTLLSVSNGNLVTPSGMSYRVLMLDTNAKKMSLSVLRKIADLAKAGATICGVIPEKSPSLTDDPTEFNRLRDEVWKDAKANVMSDKPLAQVLTDLKITKDFSHAAQADTELRYVHRTLPGIEIYWLNNRTNRSENLEATFRVQGKVPTLWRPETGETEAVSYRIDEDGTTTVDLNLTPEDAVFVVFHGEAKDRVVELPEPTVSKLTTINGEWKIAFQPERGAPDSIKTTELKSWTENQDTGIKYFSGTAVYSIDFDVPSDWLEASKLILDLGDIKNIAKVSLNEGDPKVLWRKPFLLDISGNLKAGSNRLSIEITNLWPNRLIGDLQPGITKKVTYTTMPFYQANSPLLPSGLMGPVQILSVSRE